MFRAKRRGFREREKEKGGEGYLREEGLGREREGWRGISKGKDETRV